MASCVGCRRDASAFSERMGCVQPAPRFAPKIGSTESSCRLACCTSGCHERTGPIGARAAGAPTRERLWHACARSRLRPRSLSRAALHVARCETCLIYLRDDKHASYRLARRRNADDRMAAPVVDMTPMDEQVTAERLLLDLRTLRKSTNPALRATLELGYTHALYLVLRVERRRVGFVALVFRTAPELSESTLRTLEAIAAFEAVDIESARVHRRSNGASAPRPHPHRMRRAPARSRRRCAVARPRGGVQVARADRAFLAQMLVKDGVECARIAPPSARTRLWSASRCRRPRPTCASGWPAGADRDRGHWHARSEQRPWPGDQEERHRCVHSPHHARARPLARPALRRLGRAARSTTKPRSTECSCSPAGRARARARPLPSSGALREGAHRRHPRASAGRRGSPSLGAGRAHQRRRPRFAVRMAPMAPTGAPASRLRGLRPRRRSCPSRSAAWCEPSRASPPSATSRSLARTGGACTSGGVSSPLRAPEAPSRRCMTSFQDITELRELADAKSRFLSIASHELRSPITSLRATTSLLQLDPTALSDDRATRRNARPNPAPGRSPDDAGGAAARHRAPQRRAAAGVQRLRYGGPMP